MRPRSRRSGLDWQPSGPEAFERVTRGNETALVLLSPDGLDVLTICT
jgi:hypothetical protein